MQDFQLQTKNFNKTPKCWLLILAGCKYICGPAKFHLQPCQTYVWPAKWVIIYFYIQCSKLVDLKDFRENSACCLCGVLDQTVKVSFQCLQYSPPQRLTADCPSNKQASALQRRAVYQCQPIVCHPSHYKFNVLWELPLEVISQWYQKSMLGIYQNYHFATDRRGLREDQKRMLGKKSKLQLRYSPEGTSRRP